jgi:dissimilatory sulfite reductase related protein
MNVQSRESNTGNNPQLRAIADRDVFFDRQGFLHDFEDWSEELFEFLAKEAGLLKIDDRHWRVVRFLREFYATNRRGPLNRQLKEGTSMSLQELEALFPGGIRHGARRMAGLPNPADCQ